ncbi:MAG: bifunctional DNA primase/polymerase [Bacteriovorax sp.]|nr:bifunctional DNA primase/polymerase [Bacteriovorax sp.]
MQNRQIKPKELLSELLGVSDLGNKLIPVNGINQDTFKCTCGNADCRTPGKHPLVNWKTDASSDSEQIKKWIDKFPNCNWALATGYNLCVLDVDKKSGGLESLALLVNQYGQFELTPTSNTGGGGLHLYFLNPPNTNLKNKVGIFPGIDFRGEGGMIIIPPSNHISGGRYEWENGKGILDLPVAPLPGWLLDILATPAKPEKNTSNVVGDSGIIEGQRNDTLFRLACSLRSKAFSEDFILATIVTTNANFCNPPLSDDELLDIVKGATNYQISSHSDSYFTEDNRTFRSFIDRKGNPQAHELSNFESKIEVEEICDDGLEQKRIFKIISKSANGKDLPSVHVSASEFSSLNWVLTQLGGKAIIFPGSSNSEHFKTAIQSLSLGHQEVLKFIHLGWRKLSGKYVFLHANGAITENGLSTEVRASTDEGRLGEFALPEPPVGQELIDAVKCSLEFLSLTADSPACFCLYSALWRAPLNEVRPLDFSVYVVGETGSFKSEICGVIQAHFGSAFGGKNLPENWSSTANSIEHRAYLAKDVIFVIDDYVPGEVSPLVTGRIFRGAGNKSGRGRMSSDGSQRPVYYARCLPVATAEDLVGGVSLKARMAICEIAKDDISKLQLTKMQHLAGKGVLAQAMSGYLKWLAPKLPDMKEYLEDSFNELRTLASNSEMHLRTPEVTASLAIGFQQFLKFASEVGAIDKSEKENLWERGWEALNRLAKTQSQYQITEDPANRFIDLIRAALSSHRAYLVTVNEQVPEDGTSWGWKRDNDVLAAKGTRIGWIKDDGICLEPENAFAVAMAMARDQGKPFYTSKETVWKRLAERKLTKRSDSEGKNTIKVQISSQSRPRVLMFPDKETLRPVSASDFKDDLIDNLRPSKPKAPVGNGALDGRYTNEELQKLKNTHLRSIQGGVSNE